MSLFRYLWHQIKRFFGLVPAGATAPEWVTLD